MNAGLQIDTERLGTAAQTLVQDLHLHVPAGEILTHMGPSGCGKNSVLAEPQALLLAEPQALLLDEPFSKLDATLRATKESPHHV